MVGDIAILSRNVSELENKENFLRNYGYKTELLGWVTVLSIYVFYVFPGTILAKYQDELDISQLDLLSASIPVIVGATLFLFLFLAPFKQNSQRIVGLTFLIIVLFFLYNTHFNDYGDKVIDGDVDVFDGSYSFLDYIVFIGVASTLVYFRNWIKKNLALLFCVLIFSSLGDLIKSTLASSNGKNDSAESSQFDHSIYSFSPDQNVIHVVLDALQGTIFSTVLAENPSVAGSFEGFTFFPDTLTATPRTFLSFASFFSGRPYQGIEPISEYKLSTGMSRPMQDESNLLPPLLDLLHANGFNLDLLVNSGSHMPNRSVYRSFFLYRELDEGLEGKQFERLADLSLIRILPWSGKRLVYKDGSWLFSADNRSLPRANKAEKFLRQFAKNISVDNDQPAYKLIHLMSPHQPWTTTEDCKPQLAQRSKFASFHQANCIIDATASFLDELKRSPIYDNSLIIIHGDHGNCHPDGLPSSDGGRPSCIGNANPLVLIKPPGARAKLEYRKSYVQLTDLPATVSHLLGILFDGPGQSIMRNDPIEVERSYFLFSPNAIQAIRQDRFTSIARYSVSGSIFDGEAWKEENIDNSYVDIESIPLGNVINVSNLGLSQDGKVVWVKWQGQPVKKYMYIESEGKRTSITIHNNHFRFSRDYLSDAGSAYIIDPLRNIKQLIKTQ